VLRADRAVAEAEAAASAKRNLAPNVVAVVAPAIKRRFGTPATAVEAEVIRGRSVEAAVEVAAKVLGREVMKRRQKRVYQRKPAVSRRELKVKMKRKIRHSVRNLPTVLGRKLAMIVVKKETSKITTKENRQNRLRDLLEHLTNQLGKNVCVGNHLRARHPQCPVQILVLLHRIVPGADSDLGAKRDLGPHRREVLRGRHHAVGRILLPLGVRGLDRETDLDRNKEENI